MHNRTWFKVAHSLFSDTRLDIVASQFGEHEALSLYLRLLSIHYQDYPDGIPWSPLMVATLADKCKTDADTLEQFIKLCCSREVGWFELLDDTLVSRGVLKETNSYREAQLYGSLPSKTGKKRGRPSKQ